MGIKAPYPPSPYPAKGPYEEFMRPSKASQDWVFGGFSVLGNVEDLTDFRVLGFWVFRALSCSSQKISALGLQHSIPHRVSRFRLWDLLLWGAGLWVFRKLFLAPRAHTHIANRQFPDTCPCPNQCVTLGCKKDAIMV